MNLTRKQEIFLCSSSTKRAIEGKILKQRKNIPKENLLISH
jgi:hypothetical protein